MNNNEKISDYNGEPVEIKPVSFRSKGRRRGTKSSAWKWLLTTVVAACLISLCASAWFVFTSQQVVIQIDPEPERVSIQGGIVAPKVGTYYLLQPSEYTLQATKNCFKPLNERFVVDDEKSRELIFSMEKLPGRLSFKAHRADKPLTPLEGARVLVDGKEVGRTPVTTVNIEAGVRKILVLATNKYIAHHTTVKVEGCETEQQLDFALVPGWSKVSVTSIPKGATVLLDGKAMGRTPLKLEPPVGKHNLELKLTGFKRWSTRLKVKANEPQALGPIRLKPEDGNLTVKTDPPGASVMLKKTFAGLTPLKLKVSPGTTHMLHFSKSGYENVAREVSVKSAATKTLTVKLKPKLGVINLKVEPADAEIFVDGKTMGKSRRQLRLVAVKHSLEITKKGYEPYQSEITPRPGFEQEIKVQLTRQKGSQQAEVKTSEGKQVESQQVGSREKESKVMETKPAVARKAGAGIIVAENGYELKLVRPGSFTIGSSRREQGRRSNETLRKIKLQKPFYMGIREVTNKEFRQFLSSHNSGGFQGRNLDKDALPVAKVTWEQAAMFCNWLSANESLPPVYSKEGGSWVSSDPMGTGYRLPTEAEWEYSARLSKGKASLKYPWGNRYPPTAQSGNFLDESAKGLLRYHLTGYHDGYAVSAPTAKFSPNALGLYDMGGNVAEWCHDFYSIYPYNAGKVYADPTGAREGKHHVIKGSSWKHGSISELRLSYRAYGNAARQDLGFRICRYLE